jgi:hypothetical protein
MQVHQIGQVSLAYTGVRLKNGLYLAQTGSASGEQVIPNCSI